MPISFVVVAHHGLDLAVGHRFLLFHLSPPWLLLNNSCLYLVVRQFVIADADADSDADDVVGGCLKH